MRYFTYCPMDMDADKAFRLAKPHLNDGHVVDVRTSGYTITAVNPGVLPRAPLDRYLVRVEPDHSLRVVDRNIGD